MEGILGMWSGNFPDYDKSEMLMPGLCDDTLLTDCSFSWYLTGVSGTSYIDFGTPDSSIVTDPSESAWIDIAESPWWSSTVKGFRWGPNTEWGNKDKNEYAIKETEAFTDTGSSCLIGPVKAIDGIFLPILESLETWKSGAFKCSERSKMPSFELLFGGYWLRVNPEDYAIPYPDDP